MVVPAAMFIEIAADSLKSVPEWIAEAQRKEMQSFGAARAIAIGATGLSPDFMLGCELGYAVMRVLLAGNLPSVQAGVDL
jgi:hypothetical protein